MKVIILQLKTSDKVTFPLERIFSFLWHDAELRLVLTVHQQFQNGGERHSFAKPTRTLSMQIYSVAQRIHGHFSESYFQNYRYHKSDIKHMFIRFTLHEFPYLSSWVVSVNHISRSSEARTLWRFSSQPVWGADGSLPNSRLPTDYILPMECRTTQQNGVGGRHSFTKLTQALFQCRLTV